MKLSPKELNDYKDWSPESSKSRSERKPSTQLQIKNKPSDLLQQNALPDGLNLLEFE
jgi:hypothetical protein